MTHPLNPQQILQATADFFGQPVLKLTAPGGKARTSFRAYFADHTIIVSQRSDSEQARVERHVLGALAGLTSRVPQHLGSSGGLMFQSDVGPDRLNWLIHTLPPDQRPALAAQALDAIFEIHHAAAVAGLDSGLPDHSLRPLPDEDGVVAARRLAAQLQYRGPSLDPATLSPLFRAKPARFTKWDCRAGNAGLDAMGYLRWFDFEDARLAQGPEDFAFLLADETWPVNIATMLAMIEARLTPDVTTAPHEFMTYLEEFTTLQAIRRLRMIISHAKRKGWSDRTSILKFDYVGANPHMGERLSMGAADLALRNPSTAPLKPVFDMVTEVFRKVRLPPPPPQVATD
jgi:hypothetical protein